MGSEGSQLGWRFFLLFVLASIVGTLVSLIVAGVLGVLVAFLILVLFSEGGGPSEAQGFGLLVFLIIFVPSSVVLFGTLGIGGWIGQWLVLRQSVSWAGQWVILSTKGAMVGIPPFIIYVYYILFPGEQPPLKNFGFLLLILSMMSGTAGAGVMQWRILRHYLPRAGWWIVATTVIYLPLLITLLRVDKNSFNVILQSALSVVVGWAIAGVTLVMLSRRGASRPILSVLLAGSIVQGALNWLTFLEEGGASGDRPLSPP